MVFPERTFYRFQFEVARTMTGSCDQHGLVGEHVWNVDRPRPITMIKFVVNRRSLEASRSQVDLRKGSTVCIKMLHRPHLHRANTFLLGWYLRPTLADLFAFTPKSAHLAQHVA